MDANCSVLVTAGHELIERDNSGISIQHIVKSRASLLSSLRILGGAGQLDLDGDRNLVCKSRV
jgi:hypothetical protein